MFGAEEAGVIEKEVRVRRELLRVYNRPRSHFPTLREYNDYLESVEDIVWALVEDVDVAGVKREIERYRSANAEEIARYNAERAEEDRAEKEAVEAIRKEREKDTEGDANIREMLEREEESARAEHETFLEKLARSRDPANVPRPATVAQRKESLKIKITIPGGKAANVTDMPGSNATTNTAQQQQQQSQSQQERRQNSLPAGVFTTIAPPRPPAKRQFRTGVTSLPGGSASSVSAFGSARPLPEAPVVQMPVSTGEAVSGDRAAGYRRNLVWERCLEEALESILLGGGVERKE